MAGYLGNSPSDSSVRIARQIYTTSGITSDFTFTSGYDSGYIDIYVNGERQTEGTNFTASDGSTFTILNGGVSTGSTVEATAYKTFNVATVTLGEVTDVDDLTITGAVNAGSGDIGIATIHSSGIDAGVGVITAASYVGDGSSLTGIASTDIINAEQVNVSGSTTTGIATVSTSIVVGSAVTVTATAININPTVTTTIGDSGNVDFSDDAKARFGTGNDLSIYHSGSHSFINDSGTGNLKILSSQVDILNPASNETIATFAENGAVSLYNDNSIKLQTTANGSYTTGIHTATSSLVAGINADAAVDLRFRTNRSSANQTIANINGYWNETVVGQIRFMAGEDTTNKDDGHLVFYTAAAGSASERLRIDSSGRLLVGATGDDNGTGALIQAAATAGTAAFSANRYSNGGQDQPARLYLFKSRATSIGGQTIVQDGDDLGEVVFQGSDGTDAAQAALIRVEVDGAPGDNDMPGALTIHTTADGASTPTERLRITSAGNFGLGTASPDYNMEIVGANPVLTIRDTETSQGSANARLRLAETGTADALDNYWDVAIDGQELKIIEGNLVTATADTRLTIATDGSATFAANVSDSKGNLRSIPLQDESSAPYTLVASDAGQCVHAHSSTTTVTVDPNVFSAGEAVSIVNGSGSDITIAQGTSMTLRNSADASTGNRTLSSFGMCTIWFSGASTAYISGAGLS